MKIRYHKQGASYWNTTPEFNPEGTPLNHYRFGAVQDGNVLTGEALRAHLVVNNFVTELPVVLKPSGHYEWVEEMVLQPNGTYVWQKVYTWVEDVSEAEYQEMLAAWVSFIYGRVVTVQENYLPNIPDGPHMEWQSVDMTKPYNKRFTDIPVEPGKYDGNFWGACDYDMVPGIAEFAGADAETILNILEKRTIRI